MDEILTCGDNSCLLDKPKGMATNGGCFCFDRLNTADRIKMQKYIQREKAKVAALEAKWAKVVAILEGEVWCCPECGPNITLSDFDKLADEYGIKLGDEVR